jgi:thymidylate synthase (FAD)
MCEIKFHVRVPMDTWRQWIRHRTANVNEYSTRYSIAIDASQKTDPDKWRLQAKDNKQGSEGFLSAEVGKILSEKEIKFQNYAREIYKERIEAGVAREQARKDLPLSTYTEAYWKIDLHNLLRFISLRMDSHAQYEIRQYAEVIGKEIVARWCPITWEAFMDYIYNGVKFSALELNVLKAINSGDREEVLRLADEYGWLRKIEDRLAKNRERIEFEEKLNLLGIQIPWA